jgi:hypothetical protein
MSFTTCSRKSLEFASSLPSAILTSSSRIPFYHAEEATWAIAPLLGEKYIQQKTNFLGDLWQSFVTCKFVEEGVGAKQGGLVWAKTPAKKAQ